jgi:hypothetical protein
MTTASKLIVLDPTTKPIPAEAVIAERPDTLDGKVIGLLANGKLNSVEILAMVGEVLADRYDFKQVIAWNKRNASRPCPKPIMDEMAEQCDVVITSSGD